MRRDVLEKYLKEYQKTRNKKLLEQIGEAFLPYIDRLVQQYSCLAINQDLTVEDLYSSAYLGFTEAMQENGLSIAKVSHKIIFEMVNTFQTIYQIRYIDYANLAQLERLHGPFTKRDVQTLLSHGMDEEMLQAYFRIKGKIIVPYTQELEQQYPECFFTKNGSTLELREASDVLKSSFGKIKDSKNLELLKTSFGFVPAQEYLGSLTDEQLMELNQDILNQLMQNEEVRNLKDYLELDFVDIEQKYSPNGKIKKHQI